MEYIVKTAMLSSALVPAIIFSIAGIEMIREKFLNKAEDIKRNVVNNGVKNPMDEVINKHFEAFVSKQVYLISKGKPIKTMIVREGISFYTLFTAEKPIMSISKKAFGWVVLKDYMPGSEYRSLTLPFILYVESELYN